MGQVKFMLDYRNSLVQKAKKSNDCKLYRRKDNFFTYIFMGLNEPCVGCMAKESSHSFSIMYFSLCGTSISVRTCCMVEKEIGLRFFGHATADQIENIFEIALYIE